MSYRHTTVTERNRFIDLKLQGFTLADIAHATGRSFECVRLWWRRYRDGGRQALDPEDGRKKRGGRMSQYDPRLKSAFLDIKRQHPGWGAAVARARIADRQGIAKQELPSISTVEKLWAEELPHLLRTHRPQRPRPVKKPIPEISEPHERWQLDFKEWMNVGQVGYIDVLNIRDEATPVKIASVVYPARKSTGQDIQDTLRQAFARWGLCDRLQTDRDKRLVNANHDYPFPTRIVLWLVGLGIHHDIAPSAPYNGCVENFNDTWFQRVIRGREFNSLPEVQSISDEELWWMNHKLPSHGRECHGQPPLVAYPQAKIPRRVFSVEQELDLFSIKRVHEYLTEQFWWRRVTQTGQLSLGGQRYSVGTTHAGQDVYLKFQKKGTCFVVSTADKQVIKRLTPKQLTARHITDFESSSNV